MTHRLGLLFVFGVSAQLSFGAPTPPIIRRHDQPDSLFVQLGARYSALVHLNLPVPSGAGDGEATLIAPRWVLTAAHVGTLVKAGHRVTIQGRPHTVEAVIPHPEWTDGPNDIALLRLTDAVTGVAPARIYRGADEAGREIAVVGYGDFGTGLSGPAGNNRQVRGATNRVDEATDFWLKFAFDSPESGRATPLEGISGPGDSGGPAFLYDDAVQTLVGVSSGQSTRGSGGREGRYGVVEYYTRVSRYVSWIEGHTGALPR